MIIAAELYYAGLLLAMLGPAPVLQSTTKSPVGDADAHDVELQLQWCIAEL